MRHVFITGLMIMVVICIAGCILDPRDPEEAGSGETDCWVTPDRNPKDVFLNIQCGLKSIGNSSYERSLHPDFAFIPMLQDVAMFPEGRFDGWTKEVEMGVLERIKGDYQGSRSIRFGDENGVFDKESWEGEKAEYEGDYMMVLYPGGSAQPDTIKGRARFKVESHSKGYMLKEWEDIDISGNYPTSGYLRGSKRATD